MSQQIVTGTTERRAAGRASALLGMFLAVCAASLAGCVSSSDNVGTSVADLQSGSVTAASQAVVASGASDAPSGSVSRAPKAVRPSRASASAPKAGNSGYTVGPRDVLEISVFNVPELSKSVQVANTGTINIPLLGEVPAAGRTAQEIEQDLTRQLGAKYLKNPQVTVFVKDHNSQMVTVEGAVMKPGLYPIPGKLSLVQIVATAGGLNNDLYDKNVTVFSTIDGQRTSKVYDIDDVRAGKAADPELHQGDVVVVDNSAAKVALNTALKVISPAASIGSAAAVIGD